MMNEHRYDTSRFDCGALREKLNPTEIKVSPLGERDLRALERRFAASNYAARLIDFESMRRFFCDSDWIV